MARMGARMTPANGQRFEGECPACGKTVEYTDYHPGIFLCSDCGGERPHAEGVYEEDGYLYYEDPEDFA